MKWITRERPRIDRIACPWLIKNFVDEEAEFIPAPYFKKFGKHPAIKAVVDGITAAAVGCIAGSVLVLAKRQLVDWISAGIALATMLILMRAGKVREQLIILAAALLGLLIKYGQAFI